MVTFISYISIYLSNYINNQIESKIETEVDSLKQTTKIYNGSLEDMATKLAVIFESGFGDFYLRVALLLIIILQK